MQYPKSDHYNHIFKIVSDISDKDLQKVNDDFKKTILSNVLSELPEIGITVEELRRHYFGNEEIAEKTLKNYSDFLGDEFFVRGIRDVVQLQKCSGHFKSTYLYHFDYESKTSLFRTVLDIGLPGILSLVLLQPHNISYVKKHKYILLTMLLLLKL